MIRNPDTRQQKLELFKTPFDTDLDKENRWVKLAEIVPWEELVKIYSKAMNKEMGRPGISARVAIGAMIIKHLKSLSDEATIEEIKENPYLQYFIGYEDYRTKRAFDPSLFVTIRNRMGFKAFTEFNEALIKKVNKLKQNQGTNTKRVTRQTGQIRTIKSEEIHPKTRRFILNKPIRNIIASLGTKNQSKKNHRQLIKD